MRNWVLLLFVIIIFPAGLFAQAAIGSDGVNEYYYETLHEAFTAASSFNSSIDKPFEITLYQDLVLDAPLVVNDNIHIRLIPGSSSVTIRRGVNNIGYPIMWINGENSSLMLGKPHMEPELIIDGGYRNEHPLHSNSSLIAVMGYDSKLIMYNGVTLQNNYNTGTPLVTSYYKHGSGVFISAPDAARAPEFIMKGGTIRGNTNKTMSPYPSGGGVLILDYGIFTMEGGVIMNNIASLRGGGFFILETGYFKKTGGIIYGSNAPVGLRNSVLNGVGLPKTYGHAICIVVSNPLITQFRNNTVKENDNLSFIGSPGGNGIFGEGEKWDSSARAFTRTLFFIILSSLIVFVFVFLIIWLINVKKRKIIPVIDYTQYNLTVREKEIFDLLLTDSTIKYIAHTLDLTVSGVKFRAHNVYSKMGVKNRRELFIKFGK